MAVSRLRSVNGKHAPAASLAMRLERTRGCAGWPFLASVVSTASTRPLYGRGAGSIPAGGSFRTPVAQWTERCPATAAVAGSTPAGRVTSGRSSVGRAPGFHPGEARSRRVVRSFEGPWCNRKHGELQPRWSGFEPWRACLRRGPERLGYLRASLRKEALAVRIRIADRTSRPRRASLLRAGTVPVIDS